MKRKAKKNKKSFGVKKKQEKQKKRTKDREERKEKEGNQKKKGTKELLKINSKTKKGKDGKNSCVPISSEREIINSHSSLVKTFSIRKRALGSVSGNLLSPFCC